MSGTSSSSSSMSSSSSSGMGGAGGTGGGTGGAPECVVMSDCIATECKTPMGCANGVCVWMFTADGIKTGSQVYGDCMSRVCDGKGGAKSTPTDQDPYKFGNPCFADSCDAVMTAPVGTPSCKTPWGKAGTCNNLKCTECMADGDCMNAKCLNNRCVATTCGDATVNGTETDTDCGGPDCFPCGAGLACLQNSDCAGTCDMATMRCVAPSCADGLPNGDETDMDCGGTCSTEMPPKKCASLLNCVVPGDCASGVCQVGKCTDPTCLDYVQNQNEDGIDCGGPCPAACQPMP
jgi:hypothetical protein